MKPDALINQDWNDLVFENRNKEYGAYALRKSYSGRVMEGTFASIGIAVLIFLLPDLIAIVTGSKVKLPGPHMITDICSLPSPLIDLEIKVQKEVKPKIRKITAALIPLVTSEPVIDEPINPTNTDPEPLGTIDGTDPNPVVVTGGVSASVASAGAGLATLSAPVDFAEVMPQFEGGLKAMAKFVQKRMKYPNSARHIGMEGIVFVRFVVNVDGTVTDVEVVRGIYKDCDREAARVIALMPAWKPGMQNHSPVAVRMVLPIKFKLTE